MNYSFDLSRLTVMDYKEYLKSIDLLPSRRVLLDAIDERFSAIKKSGILDIGIFMQSVSTPKKLLDVSQKTLVSEDYLKILKREIGGLLPKSLALSEFDMLTPESAEKLKAVGLRNSRDFFEAYPNIDTAIINKQEGERLFHLCGLVRINGIGALAAKMFLEAGYATVADVASADPETMAQKVNALNDEKHYYAGQKLGIKDMTFCIIHARLLLRYP